MADQPNIAVAGAVDSVATIQNHFEANRSTTLLIDSPPPLPPLIQQLQTSYPTAGLLVLVDNYDLDQLLPLLRAGVTGCISRDESVAELARAIIAVGRGEIWLPPAVAGRALAALARRDPGRRILVVVNVRHCHHLRPALSDFPDLEVVPFSEL